MKTLQVTHLCATCDLGAPLNQPQPVPGGLLHRLWRLDTTQGIFAIKQLNPTIMQKPHIRTIYNRSENIAQSMAMHDIPAVVALSYDGMAIQEAEDDAVIVYPWIDGEILPDSAVEPDHARLVGTLLGRMHTLNLQFPELPHPEWEHFSADYWDLLTVHAYDHGISWATPVRAAMPQLIAWSKLHEQAGERLSSTYVVSHRDLSQKNVIWQGGRVPRLIDWEAAGLVNPTMELLAVALDWSGLAMDAPLREDTFAALIESYVEAGGVVRDAGIDALHGVMGIWLGWLVFNMRRSLGETIANEEERQLGVSETTLALARLRRLAQHAERWANLLDVWRC